MMVTRRWKRHAMFLETIPSNGTRLVWGISLLAFRMQVAMAPWQEYGVFQEMVSHRAGTIAGNAWNVARFHLQNSDEGKRNTGKGRNKQKLWTYFRRECNCLQ
jgi:hypothetical protein